MGVPLNPDAAGLLHIGSSIQVQRTAHNRQRTFNNVRNRHGSLIVFFVFVFLVKVLDVVLEHHYVRIGVTFHANGILVVPLDCSADYFAILQNNDHGRAVLHLFQIVKIFRVGLFVGTGFSSRRPGDDLVLKFRETGSNQFSI